jgi:glucose/mannose-6-phosphate isomerase
VNLDDVRAVREADPGDMYAHLTGFAGQILEGRAIGTRSKLAVRGEGVTSIVVLGMGGSAIGGELAAGYLADELAVPMASVRDYDVPTYVGPSTLVIASSYSGNTEETLAAYNGAATRGARIICSTTGGELAARAEAAGHDLIRIPKGLPPRAALAYSLVPLIVVLGRLGLVADRGREIDSAAASAAGAARLFGLETPAASNPAKDLAAWLHGRAAFVYGVAPRTSVVATRWVGQLAENSKILAHAGELPEMNHNEIVGWSRPGAMANAARIVFLRDVDDHPRSARRIEITRDALESRGVATREVESFGESRLARILSLVSLGDFASYYLAALDSVDPTPVEPIDRLKRALAS